MQQKSIRAVQGNSLNVLVVDDDNFNLQLMSSMLQKMGHCTRLATNGPEVLALCEQVLPDLVLMDVEMPEMNGIETTQEMRRRYEHWFPIIFVTAHASNQNMIEGLRAGGDDCLFKPMNYEILQAKIRLFQIRLAHNKRLRVYRERIEEEADTAHDFLDRFTAMDKIDDPLVQFFFRPTEDFSGDLIAVARKPDNSLHVLLADSAGHGLTAALAVIPITQPFYQMTAKGFELPAIAREINRRVRDYLPLPRFVAAAMMSYSPDMQEVQVWNGGCPPVLLLNRDGREVEHRFCSQHLPFGVVAPGKFDAALEYYKLTEQSGHLLLCTDGATEIGMGDGKSLEHGGVLMGALQSPAESLYDRVVGVIEAQLGESPPQDDIALLIVDCRPPELPRKALQHLVQNETADFRRPCNSSKTVQPSWRFSITLNAPQLQRLEVVPFLLGVVGQIEGVRADGKVFLVLSDLFNNALDHGVLKLDSSLKNQPDGMEAYYAERAARLAELLQGQITLDMEKLGCASCACLKISVKDSGAGFDYAALSDDFRSNRQRHGRGIALLNKMCNAMIYRGDGSEVVVYVKFSGK